MTRSSDNFNSKHNLLFFCQANAWCARGIEVLTNQHIEKCSKSPELAEEGLQEILQFIASATEFNLESSKEFRQELEALTIPETKPLVTQVGGESRREMYRDCYQTDSCFAGPSKD